MRCSTTFVNATWIRAIQGHGKTEAGIWGKDERILVHLSNFVASNASCVMRFLMRVNKKVPSRRAEGEGHDRSQADGGQQ